MMRYHYQDHFRNMSTKEIPIYDENEHNVMMMRTQRQGHILGTWLRAMRQEFEITDGQELYDVKYQKGWKSLFRPTWDVYHNHKKIGCFKTEMNIFRLQLKYSDFKGHHLKWQTGIMSHHMTVRDLHDAHEVMTTKSSYFKIRTEHHLNIDTTHHSHMLLILLFQVAFENLKMRASQSAH
ncbi:hypothetical protein [Staphylococcus sp. 17KM0847]|uniref:hypothetical protein n=1 Tax=Staphylococcus sp. 17KM0847 TaxID=2583989 RepID=UPI0015DC6560|nr:hypothetical protein [Staphylococcus sp. 17KM0847]QLK86770.1 hypothetical protein FGL66_08735 [Staphylococcus sp. 17KM0847]